MKRHWPILLLLLTIAIVIFWAPNVGRQDRADDFVSITEEIMATPVTVLAERDIAARAAEIVFGIFREVDSVMSEWRTDSPLSAINRAAGDQPVQVPTELHTLIRRGIEIGELSDGAFDITWAALWGLWDFKADTPHIPTKHEIQHSIQLIDYRRIVIDEELATVYLPQPGMLIGLGGIAKGYALDRCAEALRARGIGDFLISAGGQVLASGGRDDRSWRVGIRDPRGGIDDYFAHIELTDTSIASSGDYERYFMLDGVRYHHILDPRTGRPARGLRSATVVCEDATLADALSTALIVLGTERALALSEQLDNVEAVLVDDAGHVHVTSGLMGRVQQKHPPAT